MAGEVISDVRVGPGWLYVNLDLTADIPADGDLTTPWTTLDAGWTGVGYTNEGHEATYSPQYSGIEVAEEKLPIRYEQTGAELTMVFAMAQITAEHLSWAFNGGTITYTGTGANRVATFEPPDVEDTDTELMIGWESFDGLERMVYRRCLQTGDVAIARKKAPDKTLVPVSFKCMKSLTGLPPFKYIAADPA